MPFEHLPVWRPPRVFYSVGQHCVHVSGICMPTDALLAYTTPAKPTWATCCGP